MAVVLAATAGLRADFAFPSFTSEVVDQAGVISPADEAALVEKLKAFRERTGNQFAVATVSSLEGASVEDYANRLFRHWKIGDRTRNDGALLLVAPNERKVRIEVGYGLEGDLTDAVSALIIQSAVLPRFKAGDIPGGISRGADDVMAVFSGQAEDYKARAAATRNEDIPPVVMIVMAVILVLFALMMWRAMRSGSSRNRRHGPWIIGGPGMGSGGWSGGGSSGGGFGGGGGGSSGGGGASGGW